MCRPHANRSGPADVNLTYVRTRVSRATCERWLVQGQPRISPDCSGAATYVVLGADLSAMWETFHGDNRKRTATNAVAPITANTVVPSPRSGLELRPSCIISPNAPDIQQAALGKRSSGASRFQMPKFIAYAVDISGTALARYDLHRQRSGGAGIPAVPGAPGNRGVV